MLDPVGPCDEFAVFGDGPMLLLLVGAGVGAYYTYRRTNSVGYGALGLLGGVTAAAMAVRGAYDAGFIGPQRRIPGGPCE